MRANKVASFALIHNPVVIVVYFLFALDFQDASAHANTHSVFHIFAPNDFSCLKWTFSSFFFAIVKKKIIENNSSIERKWKGIHCASTLFAAWKQSVCAVVVVFFCGVHCTVLICIFQRKLLYSFAHNVYDMHWICFWRRKGRNGEGGLPTTNAITVWRELMLKNGRASLLCAVGVHQCSWQWSEW